MERVIALYRQARGDHGIKHRGYMDMDVLVAAARGEEKSVSLR
jgi:hypothetical protein